VADVLLDTDVFVDHLRGAVRLVVHGEGAYSTVTRCELFAGRHVDEDAVRRLLAPFAEFPVDRGVAEVAGRLRRSVGVTMADALIAATALEHALELRTRNRKHFEHVPDLRVR
jgi:toxin FitB